MPATFIPHDQRIGLRTAYFTLGKRSLVHAASRNHDVLGMRTISTEQEAWRETASATLPIRNRSIPFRPCDPITIRSAFHFVAWSMILDFASPSSTAVCVL